MFLYDKFAVNWGVAAPFQQANCSFFYPCPCFSLLHVTMHRHAHRGLFLTSNLVALHWHFYFELFILYWGVANWKSCDGFRWTAKENSAIHTHVSILPQTPLQSRLPHNTGHSSTCYTVGPGLLSILDTAACTWKSQTSQLCLPPGNHKLVYWVCESLSVL